MKYHSESKGDVEITDMASPHICNALRKLGGPWFSGQDEVPGWELRSEMTIELFNRGCDYDTDTDKWIFPAKPEADNG